MPIYPPGATLSPAPYPWGKKYEVSVPAWNDIIHLTIRPQWSKDERNLMIDADFYTRILGLTPEEASARSGRTVDEINESLGHKEEYDIWRLRQIETAIAMSRSPIPELVANYGTVMTAIDDVQDFATTVGVLARIFGRVFPPANEIAVGAFTVGELLNRLSLVNKLTGGEKAVVCRLVRDLKKMSTKTTIKADVSKRMKRLFPSKGETLEILQTTDQFFGIGISLGPLVGLVEDVYFGAFTGAPLRFKKWKMTDSERQAIVDIVKGAIAPFEGLFDEDRKEMNLGESAAMMIINGEYLNWREYALALAKYSDAAMASRLTRLRSKFISVWEAISSYRAVPKKKTSTETRLFLQSMGIDPYSQDSWPVEGLGADASLQEIMDGFSAQADRTLRFWRSNLGNSDDGLFLDACVQDISRYASEMFTMDGGNFSTSLIPEPLILIHAMESGLNPPPNTSLEKFTEWINFIKMQMEFNGWDSPPSDLLRVAYAIVRPPA